jgi:signal transduction histidine kinase/CheY-like chemotaxis protein
MSNSGGNDGSSDGFSAPWTPHDRHRKTSVSLRVLLFAIGASVAIPFVLLSLYAVYAAYEGERARSNELLIRQAGTFATLVDREFDHVDALLSGLGTSSSLARGDLDAFHSEMQAASTDPDDVIVLATPDGELLRTTYPLPAAGSSGQIQAPELRHIAASAEHGVTNLYRAPTSGALRIAIARPVFPAGPNGAGRSGSNGTSGSVAKYVLLYAFSAARFSAALPKQELPSAATAEVADRNGVIVAWSGDGISRIGQPGDPNFLADAAVRPRGIYEMPRGRASVAFAHASKSGFTVSIAVPSRYLLAARRAMLWRTVLIAAVLSVPGFACALLANRRLSRGLRLLAEVGRPDHPVPDFPPSGVKEIDTAAVILTAAAAAQAQAAAHLQALNSGLEARVTEAVAEREAAMERSIHAQRMEALGGLASGVAHDFGNELQIVSGSAALIRENLDDRTAIERAAKRLEDVVQRGGSVIRRLLSFAREDVLHTTTFDARTMLSDLTEVLVHTLPKQIRVQLTVPENLPPLRADRAQLETVLLNIASNARQAMRAGGIFTLAAHLERADVDPAAAQTPGQPSGDTIRIDATDTGTGMSPATLARAQEPFFTIKADGTGLGLAMARGFAEQSGGRLGITSTLNVGTTVSLWLPCAAAEALETAPPSTVRPALPPLFESPRILLLDDMALIRDALARQLTKRGMIVTPCENAARALAVLESSEPVDLFITDFTMPDIAGDNLIIAAQKVRPRLPVILLTGHPYSAADFIRNYTGDGVLRLVSKPVSGRDMVEAIGIVLRQQAEQISRAAADA